MIQKMVYRLIAQIHIQFNVFDLQQPGVSAHFEESLFPNPFLHTPALFISAISCRIHQDIALIALSSQPRMALSLTLFT